MHELSVAMSLIDAVTEQLIRHDARRARSFTVEIGELSGVVPAALESAYRVAVRGTELADTHMIIVPVPIEMACPTCGQHRRVVSPGQLRCVVCGAPATAIVRGRELDIVALEVDVDAATQNPPGSNQDPQGQ